MIRTQVYFPKSQYNELKLLATKERKTFASLVREVLSKKLIEEKTRKKIDNKKHALTVLLSSLPKIKKWKESTTRKGSTNHDKILYTKR